jgi:dihydrofolate reductase
MAINSKYLMRCSLIVAFSLPQQAIGQQNQLPWHLPADLQWFKRHTLGHVVIMGRKTYESIGRPLPKRPNVVLSRNPNYEAAGVLVLPDLATALAWAEAQGETEAFVIGGGELYAQALPLADRLYCTKVDIELPQADAFFPNVHWAEWQCVEAVQGQVNEQNTLAHRFEVWER